MVAITFLALAVAPLEGRTTGAAGNDQGGYPRKPFSPGMSVLFVYGTRKPFMFHSQARGSALATRSHSAVHALRSNHWVSSSAAVEFNTLVLAWLYMLARLGGKHLFNANPLPVRGFYLAL